jgi:hypothetical protein
VGTIRTVLVLACLVGLLATAALAVLGTIRATRREAHERAMFYEPLSHQQRRDYVTDAFDVPPAFARLRAVLRRGERFALVIPDHMAADRAGLFRAFGLYYLYPALAVEGPERADVVLVFGSVPPLVLEDFRRVERNAAGGWIGRRR